MYSKTILKAVQILTTYVLHPPTLYHIPFCAIALAPFLCLIHSICILFNYFNSFKEIFCFQTSLFCFEETNLKKWAFNKQRTFTILTYFSLLGSRQFRMLWIFQKITLETESQNSADPRFRKTLVLVKSRGKNFRPRLNIN